MMKSRTKTAWKSAGKTKEGAARKSARECALSLLERSDRTEQEMRRKLKDREYGTEEIDEALEFLKEYRFIDDAEYAGRYARTYSSGKSVRQIRLALEQKGIAREFIDEALDETEVDEESQIRAYLLKKGYQSGEGMESAACRKLAAALCRRGFPYEAVRRVMERMREEV